MIDDLDLDSFIANIEQTAPEEPTEGKLLCNECGSRLEEEEDGNLTCPVCCVQATNILQFDETELHHDEQGRPVYGQRVALVERKAKHQVDYGWAWSTDEAIAHILSLQLAALEEAHLVPDLFRAAITNMWLKYWLASVAPHIKEEYSQNEMMPISSSDALKLRDIEVLFKVRDKIMVPLRSIAGTRDAKRIYHMMGTNYTKSSPDFELDIHDEELSDDDLSSSSSLDRDQLEPPVPDQLADEFNKLMSPNEPNVDLRIGQEQAQEAQPRDGKTRNLSKESIKILTLNRTLAFIEATARCLPEDDPLFAADIIRACNQHLIPFYGSSKCLPDNMKLNSRDRLMLQKTTPPTPIQLTRTASLLVNNIYNDQLPKSMPVPDLNTILKRFVRDMNLPDELMRVIHGKVSFSQFQSTQPKIFITSVYRRWPQYDRWAFAVLVYHLKILFNLGNEFLKVQKEKALEASRAGSGANYFIMSDWVEQIRSRLDLILRHDPYALYHPLSKLGKFEISSQLAQYIELQIDARATADIRTRPGELYSDPNFRNELTDVLRREIKPPRGVRQAIPKGEKLQPSNNIKFPLTDAFERTKIIWSNKLEANSRDLICRDFTKHKMLAVTNLPRWSVYDNQVAMNKKSLCVPASWPQAFKVLLDVGAFLCMCKPAELVDEVRLVEEALQPHTRVIRRASRLRQSQRGPPVQSYGRVTKQASE
uniref:Uncharacterized protein n=1 Tax=Aceria tosichella TaxID=561515 RepID=A0A6G1S8E8_9ACAR